MRALALPLIIKFYAPSRCDSPETAGILKAQLGTLVNREDNQRKFRDIESRLQSKGLILCSSPTRRATPDFDCLTSDSSENSDRGFGSGSGTSNLTSDRLNSMYDSLAAELRAKLNVQKRNTPLLLPPRDYDTVHRQRGNLNEIESRRCSNPAVVGQNGSGVQRTRRSYASREQESCGRSSGIGSADDNGSPIHDPLLESQPLQSSSDGKDKLIRHRLFPYHLETSRLKRQMLWFKWMLLLFINEITCSSSSYSYEFHFKSYKLHYGIYIIIMEWWMRKILILTHSHPKRPYSI